MMLRILTFLALTCSAVIAADSPPPSSAPADKAPSDASLKQLIQVMHARQLLDSMMAQLDGTMKKIMQQVTEGQPVPPAVQKIFEKTRSDVATIIREEFTWEKMEPMYVRVYRISFTQGEVDGMIAFYKTPAGKAMMNKMPVVMQNTMNETMQMMGPIMERMQRMQQEMTAQIQAEKAKSGG
jgi:hypothetical protein